MEHTPVLFSEVIEGLNIQKNGIYVDCTLGRGGHSKGILSHLEGESSLPLIKIKPLLTNPTKC